MADQEHSDKIGAIVSGTMTRCTAHRKANGLGFAPMGTCNGGAGGWVVDHSCPALKWQAQALGAAKRQRDAARKAAA